VRQTVTANCKPIELSTRAGVKKGEPPARAQPRGSGARQQPRHEMETGAKEGWGETTSLGEHWLVFMAGWPTRSAEHWSRRPPARPEGTKRALRKPVIAAPGP